jgi:hypothetical protein
VQAPLFTDGPDFFLAAHKVQVKYEILRAHLVDGQPVTDAAAAHGYSRAAAFYMVSATFERLGMTGLLDERRGRRGPLKLHPISDKIRDHLKVPRPAPPARTPCGLCASTIRRSVLCVVPEIAAAPR